MPLRSWRRRISNELQLQDASTKNEQNSPQLLLNSDQISEVLSIICTTMSMKLLSFKCGAEVIIFLTSPQTCFWYETAEKFHLDSD